MSAARPAQPPADQASGMPPSARVAVILLAVIGLLLLVSAGLTWGGRTGVVDQYVRSRPGATRAEGNSLVVRNVVQGLVFGIPAVVTAWFVPRRKAWARWGGVVTCGLLAVLTVVLSAQAGGIAVTSLLLVVFCVGAVSSLLAPSTAAWTRSAARRT